MTRSAHDRRLAHARPAGHTGDMDQDRTDYTDSDLPQPRRPGRKLYGTFITWLGTCSDPPGSSVESPTYPYNLGTAISDLA